MAAPSLYARGAALAGVAISVKFFELFGAWAGWLCGTSCLSWPQ